MKIGVITLDTVCNLEVGELECTVRYGGMARTSYKFGFTTTLGVPRLSDVARSAYMECQQQLQRCHTWGRHGGGGGLTTR